MIRRGSSALGGSFRDVNEAATGDLVGDEAQPVRLLAPRPRLDGNGTDPALLGRVERRWLLEPAGHDHAPTGVVVTVEHVDLEGDRPAQAVLDLGPRIAPEHDLVTVEDVV